MKTLYLQAKAEDISKYVIFSGDPWRVEMLSHYLDNPRHIAFSREFNTYTGSYKGVEITVTSTGIGAPSAAIAMEEMYQAGMEVAVRMGTVMGLREDMLGKLFLPTGCMRDEATSQTYVRASYPAVADFELLGCMSEGAKLVNRETVTGINCTLDGFYSQMKDSRFSKECGRKNEGTFQELKRLKILGADMESSCILTLANLMGIKGCVVTMTTVLENLKAQLLGQEREDAEQDLCRAVLEGILIFNNSSN